MQDSRQALIDLLERDKRYKLEAYVFVFEALNYAHEKTSLGTEYDSEETLPLEKPAKRTKKSVPRKTERHLTGQELCQVIREFALEQFGLMARCVLKNWGVTSTGDIGELVYNLIAIKQMRKTKTDRREDFDDVYDFETAFDREFKISSSTI